MRRLLGPRACAWAACTRRRHLQLRPLPAMAVCRCLPSLSLALATGGIVLRAGRRQLLVRRRRRFELLGRCLLQPLGLCLGGLVLPVLVELIQRLRPQLLPQSRLLLLGHLCGLPRTALGLARLSTGLCTHMAAWHAHQMRV